MSQVFLDLEQAYRAQEGSRFAVISAPYDGTSTWKKGADRGPEAIIAASAHLELYDIETDSEVYRRGIYTAREELDLTTPERMVESVERAVGGFLSRGAVPALLGGEHSVTIGAVRAARAAFSGLSVLQIDAHTDLRDEYEGSPLNHACVMARVSELCPIVQVGIRSMDASEKACFQRTRVFLAEEITGRTGWEQRAVELLSPEVYITFDLDGLDPSIMPSTGTPEPGGLSWYESLRLLRLVAERRRIVGFDVVELCPGADHAADFLAAKLVYKLMSYISAAERGALSSRSHGA